MSIGQGIGMDPEIAALFLGARDNNKNVSGVLNNLDSPMLALLAGVYDPVSAQGGGAGGGQMWSKYAGNTDYPFVQEIMQLIQNGADPFYLNSHIDAKSGKADFGGFQAEDMKGLAKALHAEYNGTDSGGGGDGGGRGGSRDDGLPSWLRNPTDMYTAADVPLSRKNLQYINELAANDEEMAQQSFDAGKQYIIAKRKLGPLYGKKRDTAALIDYLQNDPKGKKLAKEKNIDWDKVDMTTGQVYSSPLSKSGQMTGWQRFAPWGAVYNLVDAGLTEVGRTAEIIGKENIMGNEATYLEDIVSPKPDKDLVADYRNKQSAYRGIKAEQKREKALETAYREGALKYAKEQGRTPTKDQLRGLLNFVQNT
jgi:hypothetical protein